MVKTMIYVSLIEIKNEVKPYTKGLTSFYYSDFKCSGTGYFLTILHRLPDPNAQATNHIVQAEKYRLPLCQ
jgi:hypothetical protein